MTHNESGDNTEPGRHMRAIQQASHAHQQAEQARHLAEIAQQFAVDSMGSAAVSLAKSADSQDRTAKAFEDAAEHSGRKEYLEHAARHRQFAEDDRRMAQQLRQASENHSMDYPAAPTFGSSLTTRAGE